MDRPRILVLNPGSSSLKAALIEAPDGTLAQAEIDWDGDASRGSDAAVGVRSMIEELGIGTPRSRAALAAAGYRVVHGGGRFAGPTLIDDDAISGIESVADLAPLHNDVALRTIAAGRSLLPEIPHVACFDTSFHATLAPDAYRYPVPERWYAEWRVRRFGFHGLSVAWSVRRAASLLDRDEVNLCLVVAHLGSGCSVTAVEAGRSVDTSMGMTPLEGLMMGTRSGSIDPGIGPYLVRRGLLDGEDVADALEHGSGLLGTSGQSSDVRALQAAADAGDEAASLAITMFVRRTAAGIAAIMTALPRLDALVFTGGIGENSAEVRRRIVERLGVVGLRGLPADQPETGADRRLDDGRGAVAVLRIEAREDLVIAAESMARISDES